MFSVDVAGFSLGSVYTDEWVAQLLRCGEAAAVWGFSPSAYGTKVKKIKQYRCLCLSPFIDSLCIPLTGLF